MGYVDIQTISNPTTGQPILASWGDGARDALQYLSGGFAHCSIKETTQTITTGSGSYTALTSTQENSDIGGMHSTSSNTSRVIVPSGEGGLFDVTATVTFATAATPTGVRVLGFGKNGSQPTFSAADATPLPTPFGTSLTGVSSFVLAAGDYLELMVFHTQGTDLACTMNDFSVKWRATS
jgi:hypothetical protein